MPGIISTQDYDVEIKSYADGTILMFVQYPGANDTTIINMTPEQAQVIARQLNQAVITANQGDTA